MKIKHAHIEKPTGNKSMVDMPDSYIKIILYWKY